MLSAAELIARTVGLQQTVQEILVASAQISRQILGADSTFMAVADGTGAYPMLITDGIRDPQFREITVRPATGLGRISLTTLCGSAAINWSSLSEKMTSYGGDVTSARPLTRSCA